MNKRRDLSGCYHCVRIFPSRKITQYIDDGETALCPFCGVDAVLEGIMCRTALKRYHDKKFNNNKLL